MTCGYTVDEQIEIFRKHYNTISTISISLDCFKEMYACQDTTVLVNILQDLMWQKFQVRDLTFYELFERSGGKDFIVTAVNLEECSVRLLSAKHSPHISVVQGTLASMSIPFVFPAVQIEGYKYIDGGCMMNYPYHIFDPELTLGLYLLPSRGVSECQTFKDYVKQVGKCIFFSQDENIIHMSRKYQNKMILLKTNTPIIPLEPDRYNIQVQLLLGGLQAAMKWRFDPTIFLWFVASLFKFQDLR
jgi:hypothetical protein